ncbi:TPA: hypothetical protein IAA87_04265 [Candidatus Avigastranaerophilus faecigallinarum]|nr:hypothetical protein [Candidatus Avigastranaerophilus faecigallinarum]
MYEHKSIDYSEIRKKVSRLFFGVLTKKLPVREALVRFPKDCEDKTIIASWHALCHLEADEDIRKKDLMYKQEQDEYIEFIAYTLQKGDALPENIISAYLPYHSAALIPNTNTFKGIISQLKRFLCC